jgi:hypothetical protein
LTRRGGAGPYPRCIERSRLDRIARHAEGASHYVGAPAGEDAEGNLAADYGLRCLVHRAVASEHQHRVEAATDRISRQFRGVVPSLGVDNLKLEVADNALMMTSFVRAETEPAWALAINRTVCTATRLVGRNQKARS